MAKYPKANGRSKGGRLGGSLPIWDYETLTRPIAASKHEQSGKNPCWGEGFERGCTEMTRFARVLAVLSALATVFMVAGASTKY
jgi:hypothetical protein